MGTQAFRLPELVAPAGDVQKLKTALHFGADAVYLGCKHFNLRNFSTNFTLPEMAEAVRYAHALGKKVYLAANSFLRNADLPLFAHFADRLRPIPLDGVIVSDPAAALLIGRALPETPLHLSTQANVTNRLAAEACFSQGFRRIILARELSLDEVREITRSSPGEVEIFVHGALCMAYSGRCLLSHYLTGREANRGDCTQPCRWRYALVEETRPSEAFPLQEDARGAYILNSRDLCLLEILPEVLATGVDALKIEGRMKGVHYLATVVRAYRHALDTFASDPGRYRLPAVCVEELGKLNSRHYTTGFARGNGAPTLCVESDKPVAPFRMAGLVESGPDRDGWHRVGIRGPLRLGTLLERCGRTFPNTVLPVDGIRSQTGDALREAHGGTTLWLRLPEAAEPGDILRIHEPTRSAPPP